MAAMKQTSPAAIAVAWFIVVVPTLWGLNYTVHNALKLFTNPPAAAAAPAAPAASTTPAVH